MNCNIWNFPYTLVSYQFSFFLRKNEVQKRHEKYTRSQVYTNGYVRDMTQTSVCCFIFESLCYLTIIISPGKPHGWRSLVGYSSWGHKVRHDWATNTHTLFVRWVRKSERFSHLNNHGVDLDSSQLYSFISLMMHKNYDSINIPEIILGLM